MAEASGDPYEKVSIPLPATHGWRCKPGNNYFCADRGAVAFEMPAKWVVRHDDKDALTIHDLSPPADSARISLTVFHLPPVKGGWGQLPLEKLLAGPPAGFGKNKRKQKIDEPATPPVIHRVPRADVEMIWSEKKPWLDPHNGRQIRCRQILARARLVQCLLTFDVYEDVAEQFQSVWDDLLSSLQVAVPRDLMGHVGN